MPLYNNANRNLCNCIFYYIFNYYLYLYIVIVFIEVQNELTVNRRLFYTELHIVLGYGLGSEVYWNFGLLVKKTKNRVGLRNILTRNIPTYYPPCSYLIFHKLFKPNPSEIVQILTI